MHPRYSPVIVSLTLNAALTAAALLALCGCGTTARPPLPEQAAAPAHVTLQPGDSIRLSFSGAPELSQSQKIRSDGKLSLPHVGEVQASGKSIPQLREELIALFKSQLTNSDVVVTLESGIALVYIQGSVGHPGKFSFDRPTTILQALTEAGGINQFGNSRKVQVIRLINGREQTQVLNLRPTFVGKTTRPFYVRDGDVIDVPASPF